MQPGSNTLGMIRKLEQDMTAMTQELHRNEQELRELVLKENRLKGELSEIPRTKQKLSADIMDMTRKIRGAHEAVSELQNQQRDQLRKGGHKLA